MERKHRSGFGMIAVLAGGAVLVGTLTGMDWSASRLVAEFAESLVANVLYLGVMVASVAGGYLVGTGVASVTRSRILGWILGIVAFLAVGGAVIWLVGQIPGVGWRVDKMLESDSYE